MRTVVAAKAAASQSTGPDLTDTTTAPADPTNDATPGVDSERDPRQRSAAGAQGDSAQPASILDAEVEQASQPDLLSKDAPPPRKRAPRKTAAAPRKTAAPRKAAATRKQAVEKPSPTRTRAPRKKAAPKGAAGPANATFADAASDTFLPVEQVPPRELFSTIQSSEPVSDGAKTGDDAKTGDEGPASPAPDHWFPDVEAPAARESEVGGEGSGANVALRASEPAAPAPPPLPDQAFSDAEPADEVTEAPGSDGDGQAAQSAAVVAGADGPVAESPVLRRDAEGAATGISAEEAGKAITEPLPEAAPEEPAVAEAPRTTFADLGLSEPVLRAISDMGYRYPTPIQEQAIPQVLMTRDVLGVAQTGTGKTASFTLPMLDILAGSRARARMPRSLILEPTRELALQVAENFVQYGKYLKLTHALIIGGESMSDQKDVLMRGVDVLIATPGRLIDMFDRGSILLTDTRILVIDEADRMLDMGFIPDVERIVSLLPRTRQTLFFSATMGPEIRRLADAFLQNPKEITVARPASVATTITEGLALVAEHDKREALRRLIRTQKVQNALIFCNRKRDVDILYKSLNKHRFSAGALHGDMAQTLRFATLEKFKAGELQLLVCSDVAARGIDIGGLSHVFNFDVPHHAEDYVHRIGRTGRAGLEGHAFTIATPVDRYAVSAIEKLTGHPIPPIVVEGLDPVDWSEEDGRKRRGKPLPPKRRQEARGTSSRPARDKAPGDRTRPPRGGAAPALEPVPHLRERPPVREQAAREGRREEPPGREAQREEPPRREARRDEAPRGAHRRDDHRRERGRRDEDLGPAVVGFGDEVPAFMMLRTRSGRRMQETETEI